MEERSFEQTPEDADLDSSQLLQKFNDYISEGLESKSSKQSAEKAPSSYKSSTTSSAILNQSKQSNRHQKNKHTL